MNTKKKRGRPKKLGEKKITRSIRIKPSEILKIEEKWGTVQKWIDFNLGLEIGGNYEVGVEENK